MKGNANRHLTIARPLAVRVIKNAQSSTQIKITFSDNVIIFGHCEERSDAAIYGFQFQEKRKIVDCFTPTKFAMHS